MCQSAARLAHQRFQSTAVVHLEILKKDVSVCMVMSNLFECEVAFKSLCVSAGEKRKTESVCGYLHEDEFICVYQILVTVLCCVASFP